MAEYSTLERSLTDQTIHRAAIFYRQGESRARNANGN
jgi:hypothetical protein